MDFYITKYQGKMVQSIAPLFQALVPGIRRLEEEDNAREELTAEARKQAEEAGAESEAQARRKQRRTTEDARRLARRVCIRMASTANRCYWLSTAEVDVQILTGGGCLQSHNHQRLFTRQLQFATHADVDAHARVTQLEAEDEQPSSDVQNEHRQVVATLRLQDEELRAAAAQPRAEGDETTLHLQDEERGAGAAQPGAEDEQALSDVEGEDVDVIEAVSSTSSTNAADDFAHRGPTLQSMPNYICRMYVTRIRRRAARTRAASMFAQVVHNTPSRACTCSA